MASVPEIVSRRWLEMRRQSPAAEWDQALADLAARYAAPVRHYHNLLHIADLLELAEGYAAYLRDRDAVDLAIYFHDAIYDPVSSRNEAESAAFARATLNRLGSPSGVADKVGAYIEATKHSAAMPATDNDLSYLLDFDLSILAAAPNKYAAYAKAIRSEYSLVAENTYRLGRVKVLEGFLSSAPIFRVPRLAGLWEARARANIAGELVELTK